MEASVGYEKELQNYIDNEKAAVKLANYVGELLYNKGIELVLFRNHLLDTTNSEIINLHDYAEKVVGKKIFITKVHCKKATNCILKRAVQKYLLECFLLF